MIIVHGRIPLLGEARDQALDLIAVMAHETRQEPGCLSYEYFISAEDPNLILLIQQWQSSEAMEAHFETDHLAWFLEQLPNVIDGEVITTHYQTYPGELLDEDEDEVDSILEPMEDELVLEAPSGETVH